MNTDFLYKLIRPALFSMDAEQAHYMTLDNLQRARKLGLTSVLGKTWGTPRTVMGLTFANPVGLSAGLDKNGAFIDALAALGFGFLEIGTVTPRPQAGNPKPRMFRLPQADALINRLGFNNDGVDAFVDNVQRSRTYQEKSVLLGLNIGKNADTPIERAIDDYLVCFEKVYPYASYVTINISSPNTKNLRQLQGANELDALLGPLKKAQKKLADTFGRHVPMALKIAPDIDPSQIQSIADILMTHRIEGVIATNTTLARDAVTGLPHAEEAGGLSGRPVFEKSNIVIKGLYDLLKGEIPIIGVGGIMNGADAQAKQNAGADLVQLYTGLVYRGPALVSECVQALREGRSA